MALPWGKLLAPGGEYYWPVTNPSYAVYEKSGHAFAWQHLVRRSALKFLDKVFAGTGMLINNELAAQEMSNLPLERRIPISQAKVARNDISAPKVRGSGKRSNARLPSVKTQKCNFAK